MATETTTPRTSASRRFYWVLGALVAAFGAVRFAALRNDLWLDEVWSLRLVQQMHSAGEILTKLWHDNNHPLNSLWLYFIGPGAADWKYRLLSWVAGTLSVLLAGLVARRQYQLMHPADEPRRAELAGLLGALLVGGSYFLIHYSSEARGYAPAVAGGLLAVWALVRTPTRPDSPWALVYAAGCIVGLLAHLVVFQVLVGGVVWSAIVALRTWPRWRDRLVHLATWHVLPWAFLGLYYLGFVRKVEIGGGPKLALGNVLGTLAAFTAGLPERWGGVALAVVLVAVLIALVALARRSGALAAFYVTAIFVAPALGVASSKFMLLYPRYFIMSAALALLVVAYGLARLWLGQNMGPMGPMGRIGPMIAGALLVGFLAGNGVHTGRLLRDGRGQYQAALRYIASRTPTAEITVTSDADFRNYGMMDYYRAAAGPEHVLQYIPGNQLPPEGVQWIFLHRLDETTPAPPPELEIAGRWRYRLERTFPHAPLSGWEWYAYGITEPGVLKPAAR